MADLGTLFRAVVLQQGLSTAMDRWPGAGPGHGVQQAECNHRWLPQVTGVSQAPPLHTWSYSCTRHPSSYAPHLPPPTPPHSPVHSTLTPSPVHTGSCPALQTPPTQTPTSLFRQPWSSLVT